ncbi:MULTISPECIES: ParB/RepB/Spo0J family partition protein [Gordonia]|nr:MULTISPECIES: ParB/RepB/Spo0J family partition protein [Gordonia]
MPPLTADERAELEESIRINGVQVPILVSTDGTIVDGHHRDEIARKYNLHCPRTVSDKGEQELRGLAFSLNLHRRHLTREQKRQIVAESIKADPHLSDREHAKRTGASPSTAGAVRRDLEESGQVSNLDSRVSGDGRVRPATQPRRQATFTDESGDEIGGIVDGRDPDTMSDQDWIDAAYDADALNECHDDEIVPGFTADDIDDMQVHPESTPAKPKRRPIADQARDAGIDLTKVIERLNRIAADDRFESSKEKVAPQLRGHLTNAIESLQAVLDRINNSQGV